MVTRLLNGKLALMSRGAKGKMELFFVKAIETGYVHLDESYAARGDVFGLIGVIILQTAFAVGPKQAQGFDGALAALAHAPYGQILLGAVALGLILFGAYSALCAKWNKIGRRRPA